ncbi:hypothetical protein SDC9_178770 [bioreactor metagenome]|uniref:Uncharacterized protein n=1 Tax=bioreactor metagenome TaxID=1076179 RepID=A0A645GYG4_9ZZZZ
MRVIFTQYFTNNSCGFLVGFISGITQFRHTVQNTAMDRLKAVTYVRKGPGNNNRHRIIDVGRLHFIFYINLDDSVFLINHI